MNTISYVLANFYKIWLERKLRTFNNNKNVTIYVTISYRQFNKRRVGVCCSKLRRRKILFTRNIKKKVTLPEKVCTLYCYRHIWPLQPPNPFERGFQCSMEQLKFQFAQAQQFSLYQFISICGVVEDSSLEV